MHQGYEGVHSSPTMMFGFGLQNSEQEHSCSVFRISFKRCIPHRHSYQGECFQLPAGGLFAEHILHSLNRTETRNGEWKVKVL